MIRFLGWCTLLALFVAIGWFGRDALSRMPVVRAPYGGAGEAAPRPVATVARAPKARPAPRRTAEQADPPERDNVGPGFATQGIGYYDVRDTSRR